MTGQPFSCIDNRSAFQHPMSTGLIRSCPVALEANVRATLYLFSSQVAVQGYCMCIVHAHKQADNVRL